MTKVSIDSNLSMTQKEVAATGAAPFLNKKVDCSVHYVTAKVASQFLSQSENPRATSKMSVELYAGRMLRGQWMLNGEPMIFDANDHLISGHHRCRGIIEAATQDKHFKGVPCLVIRGVDPNWLMRICNLGIKRRLSMTR